jgi:hypothetical protein
MLDAQGVVYLSLKFNERADLAAGRKSIRFHELKNSALIRLRLFRVRKIFEYHSRGGPRSLFRDRTAPDIDALQSTTVPITESGHGAWRSQQLLSD